MKLKKLLSLFFVCVFSVCLLAACKSNIPVQTLPNGQEDTAPLNTGIFILNIDGALEISYDAEGNVLSLDGVDESGLFLADQFSNYIGKPCAGVVRDLTILATDAGLLSSENAIVIIKQNVDSYLPSDTFLASLVSETEAVAQGVPVLLIKEADLTNGYISLDTAKELVARYLNLEDPGDITGDPNPIQGLYALSLPSSLRVEMYTVDAVTGTVTPGYPGGSADDYILEIDPNGAMYDPNDPFLFPDETQEVIVEEENAPDPDGVDVDFLSEETVS